eukprot:1449-Heterococcus_DN1.PRE.3
MFYTYIAVANEVGAQQKHSMHAAADAENRMHVIFEAQHAQSSTCVVPSPLLLFALTSTSLASAACLDAHGTNEATCCGLTRRVSDHTTQGYHKEHRQEQQHIVQRNSSYVHM